MNGKIITLTEEEAVEMEEIEDLEEALEPDPVEEVDPGGMNMEMQTCGGGSVFQKKFIMTHIIDNNINLCLIYELL